MPYINKLQDENAALQAEVARLKDGIRSVQAYLYSDKFAFKSDDISNSTVNVNDVILRLNEVMYP